MASTSNQNHDQAAPLRLVEPDLAAWAEKITIDSIVINPRLDDARFTKPT